MRWSWRSSPFSPPQLWYAASAWISISGPPMPAVGYVAMTFGVVISLVVGCGLMALLFYSSRHGYDEHGYDEQHAPIASASKALLRYRCLEVAA